MRETIKVQCMHDRPTGGKQYKECKGEQKIDQKKSREGGPSGGGSEIPLPQGGEIPL